MSLEVDVVLWAKRNRINSGTFFRGALWAIFAAFFSGVLLWTLELSFNLPLWGIVLAVGLLTFVVFILVIAPKQAAEEKAREISLQALGENLAALARQFGSNASSSADEYLSELRFDRDGVPFKGEIETQVNDNVERFVFTSWFMLPAIRKVFYIQPKSFFSGEYVGCTRFLKPELLEEYELHSSDESFLVEVLSDSKLLRDISYYPTGFSNQIKIGFDNGQFSIAWYYGERVDLDMKAEVLSDSLKQVIQTAILFRERLKIVTSK